MTCQFNILLSSAGRRVGLLRLFKAALEDIGLSGSVVATDTSPLAAAWQEADRRFLVPRCEAPDYIDCLIEICLKNDVKVVVPTIDTELPILAAHREHFAQHGVTVLVSSKETIAIAADKALTHQWLVANGFPTVRQATVGEALASPQAWPLPLIAKPKYGSSSVGLVRVRDWVLLEQLRGEPDYIVESIAGGDEHTVDVLINRAGEVVCAVPRRRIEVRGGEVSKGVTVRNEAIQEIAVRLARTLPGAYGVINIQLFHGTDGSINVLEINARFGGGFPLSAQAGANYPRWILEDLCGLETTVRPHAWKAGLTMLRYDAEVFVEMEKGMAGR
jgi:carbamoyl-phosphate synthase large subunit